MLTQLSEISLILNDILKDTTKCLTLDLNKKRDSFPNRIIATNCPALTHVSASLLQVTGCEVSFIHKLQKHR